MRDTAFKKIVRDYYRQHGRHDLPWRNNINPYRILVSEIMLQQTQVDRVIPKYRQFLKQFPSFRALASAPTAAVLASWQGLGYNRRALMLQRCAQAVVAGNRGRLPQDHAALCELPGLGPYTAGAILSFAFNVPISIIETNIRRVYLYHYFPNQEGVADNELMPIIERTLDRKNPREWHSALMDYGTYLAGIVKNPNRRSRHYMRQSKFEGSRRQLRGEILRQALAGALLSPTVLARQLNRSTLEVREVIAELSREGLIAV